jgi:hypothetical protein
MLNQNLFGAILSPPMSTHPLSMRKILSTWWPLAASWLLMSAELPILSAIVARLSNPEINLAAYGGVVYPLALIIESPIIMLLAASTALSKDWDSYSKIYRFMMVTSAALTILHLLVVLTPLYYFVVNRILSAPVEIVEPARLGLMIMVPWTWAIAYRRFHQGVLIRFGHSRTVSTGTTIRLATDLLVLGAGYLIKTIPGIVVAASAVAAGVLSEALYIGIIVRPVLRYEVKPAPPIKTPITLHFFLAFYIPLVMTSLLSLLAQPIGSAALSRMPLALESLAVWPVISGLTFLLRSLGIAYNEVVVSMLDEPHSSGNLMRFALWLSIITTIFLLLLAVTPLAGLYFTRLTALSPELAELARRSLWIALPLPALAVWQSWYQGAILHYRRTQAITEAVILFLVVSAITLYAGVTRGTVIGLYVGMFSLTSSTFAQTIWLWLRSRPALRTFQYNSPL